MVKALAELCQVPAVAPENDGDGELLKAEIFIEILTRISQGRPGA
jgi:hypothetical protein